MIIKRGLNTVLTIEPLASSTSTRAVMGEEEIKLSWEQASYTALQLGDYVTHEGSDWSLYQLPTVKKNSSRSFRYDAVFKSTKYFLGQVIFMLFDNTPTPPKGEFTLTATAREFMFLLIDNLNRVAGSRIWMPGEVVENEEYYTLTFNNEDCLSVLGRFADEFDTEYHINNHIVHLNRISTEREITLEYGSTLYDIERVSVDSESVVTRLYPFGSTRNLPADYRGGNSPLRLPERFGDYIESNINLYGIIEQAKTFDKIFPRLSSGGAGTVTGVGDKFTFTDSKLDFNVNDSLIDQITAKVRFNSGECAGYDFEIKSYNHATKTFVLIENTQEANFTLPTDLLKPAVGDKYVLLDVIMPESYRTNAEDELWDAANTWLSQNNTPKTSYRTTFSSIYAKQNLQNVECGDTVTVIDTDLGINEKIRITKIIKGITDYWTVQFDLSNTVTKTTLQRITSDIASLQNDVVVSNDRINRNALRSSKNADETRSMVFDPDGYFHPDKIKPLSIETGMLSVTARSQNFQLSVLLQPNYAGNAQVLRWSSGVLAHFTLEENTIKEWIFSAGSVTLTGDNQTRALYIYARCSLTGTTGDIFLSPQAFKFDSDSTNWLFLIGILHTPADGVRGISLSYGQTTINGQFIQTGVIKSINGAAYFNLNTGEIGGKITFVSGSGSSQDLAQWADETSQDIQDAQEAANEADRKAQAVIDYAEVIVADFNNELANIQAQVDGQVDNWFYAYSPTLSNYPASDWTTNAEKDRHVGDTFTNTAVYPATDAGKSWRFVKNGTVYSWSPIADSDAVKALQQAALAQSTADGKSTTYLVQPTKYNSGDMWVLGADITLNSINYKSGEILTATTTSATFNPTHWVKRVRYTDDTAVENLKIGGVNLLKNSFINKTTSDYNIADFYFAEQLVDGEELTITLWGTLGGGKTYFGVYNSGGSASMTQLQPNRDLVSPGVYRRTFKHVIGASSNSFLRIYHMLSTTVVESTVTKIKLERGNKGTDYSENPADVQFRIDEAKQAGVNAQNAATNANNAVNNLNTYVDGAFQDGVISQAEAKAIEKYLNSVNETKLQVDSSCSQVYNNTYLTGTPKSNLLTAKTALNTAYTNLINSINTAISDGKTTVAEKTDVDTKYSLFNTALATYQVRLEEANNAIKEAIAQSKIDNTQIGARNLIAKKFLRDWNLVNSSITQEGSDADGNYLAIKHDNLYSIIGGSSAYNDIFQGKIKFKENTQYCFKIRWKLPTAQAYQGLILRFQYTDNTIVTIGLSPTQTTVIEQTLITAIGKTVQKISCTYGAGTYRSLIYDIQLTEGNKQTAGYIVAQEDIDAQIDAIEVGGVNLIKNGNFFAGLENWNVNSSQGETPPSTEIIRTDSQLPKGALSAIKITTKADYQGVWQNFLDKEVLELKRAYTLSFIAKASTSGLKLNCGHEEKLNVQPLTTAWLRYRFTFTPNNNNNVVFYAETAGTFYITNIQLEVGNRATDFKNGYLEDAIKGSAEVNGGLVLGNVIGAKDATGIVKSYMSGLASNPTAFAAGVENFGQPNESKSVDIRHDGTSTLAGGSFVANKDKTGRIGNVEYNEDGLYMIGQNSTSLIKNIPLADMINTQEYNGTLAPQGSPTSLPKGSYNIKISGVVARNFAGSLTVIAGSPYVHVVHSIYLLVNSSEIHELDSNVAMASILSGSNPYNISVSYTKTINKTINISLPNATNTVELKSTFNYFIASGTGAGSIIPTTNTLTGVPGATYSNVVSMLAIANNGMYISAFGVKFLVEITSDKFNMDIPSGLGGGSVGSTAGGLNLWGSVTNVSRAGSVVTINHGIGDVKYMPQVALNGSSSWYFQNRNANSIQIVCSGAFDFVLVRIPY